MDLELSEQISDARADIVAHFKAKAILLFGSALSFERGTRAMGDIDFLALTTDGNLKRRFYRREGTWIDLYLVGTPELRKRMHQTTFGNLNILLKALSTGVILADDEGDLAVLQGEAHAVWLKGPALPPERELAALRVQVTKLAVGFPILSEAVDLPCSELASLKAAEIVDRLLMCHYQLNQLWYLRPDHLLSSSESCYAETYELMTRYLSSTSFIGKREVIQEWARSLGAAL